MKTLSSYIPQSESSRPIRSATLVWLGVLATLYTAYFAAPILIPITVAFLLYFLLAPMVAALVRWNVPRPIASGAVVLLVVATLAAPATVLTDPAAEWLRSAPTSLNELGNRFKAESGALADVREASAALEDAMAGITGEDEPVATPVEIREPGMLDNVLSQLPAVAASALVVLVLTLFLLISGDSLTRKVTALGATFAARRRIVVIVRQIEREIARYLGTVTIVNTGLAFAVGGAMYAAGMPNPLLWGAIAGILNFAPYAGAMLSGLVILVASATAFDTTAAMLLPPALFLAITTLEGQIVTPILLGRRLEISPVVILLSVLILGWIWGLVGALIAVPIVTSIRIALTNIPRLRAVGVVLAR